MPEREPLIVAYEFVTVAVSRDVERAFMCWARDHIKDLDAHLEPHGLTAADLAVPDLRRLVYADEVAGAPDREVGSPDV